MAYSTTAHITTGQLKTAMTRVKEEFEAADTTIITNIESSDTTYEVATDDEVAEMLDEVFGSDSTEEDTNSTDGTTDSDGTTEE